MAELRYIGRSIRRPEGPQKLRGRAPFVADVKRPGMTYARLVLSPHPHARIRGIATEEAAAVPGVVAVLTGKELARTRFVAQDEVYYVGEPVAVVVAEDPATAEDAAELVAVDYEELPAVLDPIAAMAPDAPLVRPANQMEQAADAGAHGEGGGGALAGDVKPRNVHELVHFRRGDVDRALAEADVVVEQEYEVARVYQAFLETLGAAGEPEPDGRMTVWTTTQGQFIVRQQTARRLGVPEQDVRVVPMTVGGGFGGKILNLEPLVAAVSRHVGRPVSLVLDRQQDFLVAHPAPWAKISVRLGARRDGTLTALAAKLVFDAGARSGAPVGIAAILLGGTYRVPHLDVVSMEVLTHKVPVGAYRAPGAPQAYFALESTMDMLAERLGMDPIDLRLKNASREGDPRPDGGTWGRIGLVECLERLKTHPLWTRRPENPDEGVGVAVGGWGGGLEPAAAACQIQGDGTVTVQVGSVDITGAHASMALIAAEVLGIPVEQVRVVASDTSQAPYAGMSGGSKITYTVGAAVQQAAMEVRRQLLELAAERLEAAVEDLEIVDGRVGVRGVPAKSVSVAELARLTNGMGAPYAPLYGHGRSSITQQSPAFTAHIARVKVDRETGVVRVVGYAAAQDVGRAINPAEVVGQIQGGVAQGIGRALLERMAYDPAGQLTSTSFMDYLLPTVHDVPPVSVELVEVGSPYGPFGAKGVGEPPAVPGGAAIANAVYDAVGVRLTKLPISPDDVLAALTPVTV